MLAEYDILVFVRDEELTRVRDTRYIEHEGLRGEVEVVLPALKDAAKVGQQKAAADEALKADRLQSDLDRL